MKAVVIILGCLTLAVVLRVLEVLTSRKRINSVGAKSNRKSSEIPTMNINDPISIEEGLEHYKNLED